MTSVAARDDAGARKAQHEKEVRDLQTQVSFLEEEISVLRRKLAESPRQVRVLDERLHEAQASLAAVTGQNERLVATLKEAREQIIALKEEVDRLAQPPSAFGTFLAAREDGTVDIFTGGRKLRVNVSPGIEIDELQRGQEVMLNEALNVVAALEFETQGEVVMLKEAFEDGERALVIAHADEERVIKLAEPLRDVPLRAGDSLMLDTRSGYAYE
ncbi:MAG: proteasome ATPase, partial [Actinoallomurus sp.]